MVGIVLVGEDACLIRFLRFVAENHDYLAFNVDAGVIVVVVFGGGNSIAGEDYGPTELAAGREVKGNEVFRKVEHGGAAVLGEMEAVGFAEPRIGGHLESLVEALAIGGLQSKIAELGGDKGAGLLQFRTA